MSQDSLLTFLMVHLGSFRVASLISELRYVGGTMFGDFMQIVHAA